MSIDLMSLLTSVTMRLGKVGNMDHLEFFRNVQADNDMILHCTESDVVVTYVPTNRRFAFEPDALRDHDWGDLADIITSKRMPHIMKHVTRVCGYFANVSNFNPSKVSELRDRQRGNYMLPAA